MDNKSKEIQLEIVADRAIKQMQLNLAPPIFELYAALLAMSLAILMFLVPELLEGDTGVYAVMTGIMPQEFWAMMFFVLGVSSAIGMLFNHVITRVIVLSAMSFAYGSVTVIYGMYMPNFGFILMLWLTIFTFASIPLVKYTGIWTTKHGKEEF